MSPLPSDGNNTYRLTVSVHLKQVNESDTSHVSVSPDKPFMAFWAPVAMHSPHQASQKYIDYYKGKFDMGWDNAREVIYKKQLESGIIPQGTELSPRIPELPAWESLNAEEKSFMPVKWKFLQPCLLMWMNRLAE